MYFPNIMQSTWFRFYFHGFAFSIIEGFYKQTINSLVFVVRKNLGVCTFCGVKYVTEDYYFKRFSSYNSHRILFYIVLRSFVTLK